jgi:regulator of chromosome condensation
MDMKQAEDDSASCSDSILNLKVCPPTEIDDAEIPQGTAFTQLLASHNATFALTDTGLVYGSGAFRLSSTKLIYL